MQAYVNGQRVAPDVTADRRHDISHLLQPGDNEIRVVVATGLKAAVLKLARSGQPNLPPFVALQNFMPYTEPYGLLGPVRLIPFGRVEVPMP